MIKEIDTFKDLFIFLQNYEGTNIIDYLNKGKKQEKGYKQEALLRLFTSLGLIDKINNKYKPCKGNFNLKTITEQKNLKEFFYNEKNDPINYRGNKGDSSDLTCILKTNKKHLLTTTSKLTIKTVEKLHIDKILTNFQQYKEDGYSMSLCICIKDMNDFENMKNRIEITNKELKLLLNDTSTIVVDWNDINQAYYQFKSYFHNKSFDSIIDSNKETLRLKMHQDLTVFKTLQMKSNKEIKVLWGHIQRSGKSYIIGGCIIKDSIDKSKCNYLIITTAPKETIEQQRDVCDCLQLQEFNIVVLNGKNKKPLLKDKNIIICSKQFLQTKIDKGNNKHTEKTKSIPWLKNLSFDMRFIDESHNGGTTELAQKTLNSYGKKTFTVQITATYSKPIDHYNIPKENWILWDLEDIKLCKNINTTNIHKLVEKHGTEIKDIIENYSDHNIITEYSKYPELWLLTDEIKPENVKKIIENTKNNDRGWSTESCFLLKQGINKDGHKIIKDKFQNESEVLKIWYRIFGRFDEFGIEHEDYPIQSIFMERIKKICHEPNIDSRFIGEGEFSNEPMIIMAFLPQNNINEISKATIQLLEENKVIPDYEIISINSKTTNDPKQLIEDTRIKARNSGKKGVLVLSGKQCSLGVSIENCDIVILLNNSISFDMIYQMMYRCMTEGENKKCAFVIDLNIHRAIGTSIINYASLIKPDKNETEACKYILQERLINLNGDHWMSSFGNDESKLNTLCKNIHDIYVSKPKEALINILNRLRFKEILLTKEEQIIFNTMFSNVKPTKQQKELIDKIISSEEEKIKKGIEKNKVETINTNNEILNEEEQEEKEEKKINYMDILKHIIPLICLLTIHNEETCFIEMFKMIQADKYIYDILIDQTQSWWGESIDSKIIQTFINVYIKYIENDKETSQIIKNVKTLFFKNINNSNELSSLIDKYLIPQELDKKENAEVSTPFKLRSEMLNKIDPNFWKTIKKVFEPCVGKGGFLLDIIDKFMIGLKEEIPDEKIRYKKILEECLYFSDKNPTNIFICKLLIDPYNEHNLNYNEGNTLELDITKDHKHWKGIDHFDAIIGNPPYQGTGRKKLYINFIEYSINNLKLNGILLFITPQLAINYLIGNEVSQKKIQKLYDIKYINVSDDIKKIHFKNIGSDFTYYYIIKKDYTNNTEIVYKNNKQDLIRIEFNSIISFDNKQHNTILNKLVNPNNEWGRKAARIDKDLKLKMDEEYTNKIIYKIKTNQIEYRYTNRTHEDYNKYKVLYPTLGEHYIIDKDRNLFPGTSFVPYIPCSNLKECNNILKLKDSKIFKYLIKNFENQRSPIDYIWRKLSKPSVFDIDIVDENTIYKYFNLTEEDIDLIEEYISE